MGISQAGHLFLGGQFDPQPTCLDRTPSPPEPLEASSGRNAAGQRDDEAGDANSFALPVAFLSYETYDWRFPES